MNGLRPLPAIGVLLVAGALGSLAGAAAAPAPADPIVTVVYSGTASNKMTFTNPAGKQDRTDEVTVSWTFRFTGPVSKLSGAVPFRTQSAKGFFSQKFAPPNDIYSCAYTIQAGRGNVLAVTSQSGSLVIDLAVPSRVQRGDPSAQLTAKKAAGDKCNELTGGLPVVGDWSSAPHPAAPRVTYELDSNRPRTWRFIANRTWNDGRENDYRLASTVVVSPGSAPASDVLPPTPPAVRDLAAGLVLPTVKRSLWACLSGAADTIVFTAVGVGRRPVVEGTMAAVAGPICAEAIKQLRRLELIANDPPVPGYTVVAQVPAIASPPVAYVPCARYPKAGQELCGRLQRAGQAWVDASRRLSAVVTTLATTVGRESAAAKAGNTAALRTQQKAALALVPVAGAAQHDQAVAARELASILRSAKAKGTLTAAQSERALSIVRDRLVRAGISRARVDAILRASRPGVVDVLAQLGKS